MLRSSLTAAVGLCLSISPALAQDLTHKAPPQRGTIVLHNASIHPIAQPAIATGFIVFTDGIIKEVGEGQPSFPDPGILGDIQKIDLKGAHVYPGLISPWTQLGLTEIQAVGQTQDLRENGGITPEVCPAHAVNPDSTLIPVTRSNGIMLAGVFPEGSPFPGQASVIRLDGWTISDMEVTAFAGQVCRWPNMRTVTAWWMDRSEDDQRRDISTQLESITKALDTAANYRDARAADPSAPADLRWDAMIPVLPAAPASEAEAPTPPAKPIFFLANDQDQINAAVSYAQQRSLRAIIVGGRDAADCAELLKKHNVPVIVTGTHVFPRRDDAPYDDGYTLPARLQAAGVQFTIANSDDTAHERNLPYSVAMAVAHGLDHDAGIRTITLSAAEILGIADRYGSLEPGKSATIIITTGSPLDVRTQITSAYIDGRAIDLTNKQTELAEKYEERYKQQAK